LALLTYETPFGLGPTLFTDFFVLFGSVVIESLPFLVLGSLLSAAIQIFISSAVLLKLIPKIPVLRQFSIMAIGFVFPVCECGNVPLSRSLIRKGLDVKDAVMLLIAAPILNPVTLLTTYQAFQGTPILVISRAFGAIACALLVRRFIARYTTGQLLTPAFAASCEVTEHSHSHETKSSKLNRFSTLFTNELTSLFPALLLGAGIAATLQVAVPRTALLNLASTPVAAIAIMMLLAFVISICSNVDAFFALALAGVFPTGAILAFLILGPIVDIKMLSLMRTTFSRTTIVALCVIVASTTLAISLGVQYVF
jgi:uncharacterized membrane protein YraQ (UPF0718 family)